MGVVGQTLVDGELVAQREDLELEGGPCSEGSPEGGKEGDEDGLHGEAQTTPPPTGSRWNWAHAPRNLRDPGRFDILGTHRNPQVMLCERGIRTFETMTRNTLDINAVPVVKALSHLPVIVDPSHGIGIRRHVPAIARAGVAAGADGLIVEVHPKPEKALSDGHQSLTIEEFEVLMRQVAVIAGATGRPLA